jgi:hypothetical protein
VSWNECHVDDTSRIFRILGLRGEKERDMYVRQESNVEKTAKNVRGEFRAAGRSMGRRKLLVYLIGR